MALVGMSKQNITTPTSDGELAQTVESTFNDLWYSVIATDPKAERALFVVGMILVVIAIGSAIFSLKKGMVKTFIGLLFACIPGFFLMFPQQVLLGGLGFIGILWSFVSRLADFIF
ncbi:hypothetical protein [Glutamicibacter ardleyensis]|uniref:hypothetical protein n=1 Tax=Glutamicibacter ardleyensis TaxID=225894 RepID=UPI003FCF7634